MQRQDRLLLDGLDRHEAHVRSRGGFADRLGVGRVVLVRLHVRLDELRCNQPNRVSHALELTSPVVRAGLSLHAD